MVSILSLWLPIVLSAVAVFFSSYLLWSLLPWHRSDFSKLPDEEAARAALRDVPPGAYTVPHTPDPKMLADPEHLKKWEEGPLGILTMMPKGPPRMGKTLGQWFVWTLLMAVFAAYVAGRTLGPGTAYLQVFRVVGTVTWLGYGTGLVQESIWFGRPWKLTVKQLVDALIYGLLTAGFFGWLWPR